MKLTTRADEWSAERTRLDVLARWHALVRFGLGAKQKAAAHGHAASHHRRRCLHVGWDGWRRGWSSAVLLRHKVVTQTRRADELLFARRRVCLADAITQWSVRSVYWLQKQKQRKEAQLVDERVKELRTVLAQGRKWAERLVL